VATAAPIAVSCWFWADPAISQNGTLLSICAPSPSFHRFELAVIPASQKVAVATNSGGAAEVLETTTTWTSAAWHHAFGVWQSTTSRKAWLNGGGQSASSASKVPTGIAETLAGASRISSPFNHFQGRLAEAAIWAGSGVENMDATEAAILAKGFAPRCLGRWRANLVLYQDLIRPLNRPGTGPAMTEVGSPATAAHPRIIYPTSQCLARFFDYFAFNPYHADAAMVEGSSVLAAFAATAGVEIGLTIPLGEVSV
jgi:hypothetical protein